MTLPKYLFWDVDLKTINFEENCRFVIARVILRGSIDDWITIKEYYGIERIKDQILQMRDLDKKTLNFFSIYFDIDKINFKCFSTQQSSPRHFSY